jgi:hypothetical protein
MTQFDKVLYTAKVHTTGGRDGTARSGDGRLDINLSPPGTSGSGTNPEQLFAAGWSACRAWRTMSRRHWRMRHIRRARIPKRHAAISTSQSTLSIPN